jgi:hypothetical protein
MAQTIEILSFKPEALSSNLGTAKKIKKKIKKRYLKAKKAEGCGSSHGVPS